MSIQQRHNKEQSLISLMIAISDFIDSESEAKKWADSIAQRISISGLEHIVENSKSPILTKAIQSKIVEIRDQYQNKGF